MNREHLITAKLVLAKASLGDQTFSKPDPGVMAFWAEALADIDRQAALRAVTAHYTEEHRRIMPADVIKRVRAEAATFVTFEHRNFNAVPDADPDDVPAYLEALRAGVFVDNSPTEYQRDRPVRQLIEAALRTSNPKETS
jgi:hypothetical protein